MKNSVRKTTLIPIAGGKGGVGKSLITSNLAVSLASKGMKTIVVDLDFGGSNLHSYLGMHNDYPSIGDYLLTKEGTLSDYQVSSPFPNLTLIPGDGRTPFLANLPYAQKIKLARQIQHLDADYVLLDIGAGASFNTIDYFGMSGKGLLVTTPDFPALMNMITFLKNFLLRNIIARIKNLPRTEGIIKEIKNQTTSSSHFSLSHLRDKLFMLNPEAAHQVDFVFDHFTPRIILNMGDEAQNIRIAKKVNQAILDQLSVFIEWFGFLYFDNEIRQSVRNRNVFMQTHPESRSGVIIERLANSIVTGWHFKRNNSYEQLLSEAISFEDKWKMRTRTNPLDPS